MHEVLLCDLISLRVNGEVLVLAKKREKEKEKYLDLQSM